jgi:hypothetical protein
MGRVGTSVGKAGGEEKGETAAVKAIALKELNSFMSHRKSPARHWGLPWLL